MDNPHPNKTEALLRTGDQHLPDLFADCARQYPLKTAVIFQEKAITYADLDNISSQFANFLMQNGVTTEDIVGVSLDRSPDMLIVLLAIAKAGAAYLPLDPEYPKDRIEFMLHDSGAKFLIKAKNNSSNLRTIAKKIYTEDIYAALSLLSTKAPKVAIAGKNLAYVLYTSGSTGNPKGVMVEHHSLTNLLHTIQQEPGLTSSDVLLSVTTISFDIAAVELFLPLITGATVIITDTVTTKDSRMLLSLVKTHHVSVMQATPNTWRMMLEAGWNEYIPLKIFCGGEPLTKELADRLLPVCASLWNMYGPTETTIYSIITQVKPTDEVIAIGHPVGNTVVYLLDDHDQPVPAGQTGQICIGGQGVSRGYINQPALNQNSFVEYINTDCSTLIIYKTGDLGKLLPNGDIQCFGRIDHQVKISGYRIELGEIESVIQSSGLVSQSIVLPRETDDGNKSLVAYAIPAMANLAATKKELYEKQVKNWEAVYDVEYEHTDVNLHPDTNPQFNTNIWKDSFTIKIIPVAQMQEWLADITGVILTQKPQNVLEIGSGTGLIYYQIAPHLKKYIGTDFSRSGINAINNEVTKQPGSYPPTKLMVCAAHEVDLDPAEGIDTIIINSVIQYFPGEDYLGQVLAKSIDMLGGQGKIIVGDVRDVRLLNVFKKRVLLTKLPPETEKAEFEYLVDQEILKEEELCVSPEFFYNLKAQYPQITHVDIQWKQGTYVNELIAYRYTVIIHIGTTTSVINPQWLNGDIGADKNSINSILQQQPDVVALSNVYNPRLSQEILIEQGVIDPSVQNLGNLSHHIDQSNPAVLDVQQIIQEAKNAGYICRYFLNSDPLKVNLAFVKPGDDRLIQANYLQVKALKNEPLTNNPLMSAISGRIQQDIYKLLSQKLPAFMIPSSLTILSKFPLTKNGKVDRQILLRRSKFSRVEHSNYRGPRNDVESKLVALWKDLLGVDTISIDDNFFELGGNSLIAIRLMITLEKETGKDLPLSSLFEYPTIERLASVIQNTHALNASKCLVRLKPEGNRVPLYIVHGWGLTVFIFKDVVKNLHPDQPVYALQGIGIDGYEEPLTKVEDIAARYLAEVLEQNPTGPYAFAGYSLGGVIACEMARQLRIMGKKVTMMAMFDAYAHTTEKKAQINLMELSAGKIRKFFLRVSHNLTQLIKDPNSWNEKLIQVNRKLPSWIKKSNIVKLRKDNDVDFYSNELSKLYFTAAVQNYKLSTREDTVELFRASKNIYYYMDDPVYLGWKEYANTVNLYRLKGTHTTMFLPPNDKLFAEYLQQCLDRANQRLQ